MFNDIALKISCLSYELLAKYNIPNTLHQMGSARREYSAESKESVSVSRQRRKKNKELVYGNSSVPLVKNGTEKHSEKKVPEIQLTNVNSSDYQIYKEELHKAVGQLTGSSNHLDILYLYRHTDNC